MFKLGLCQTKVYENKDDSIESVRKTALRAKDMGADVICIPEMWNTPYSNRYIKKYAEGRDGGCYRFMKTLARDLGVYFVGGSIPFKDEKGDIYNTSFVFSKDGDEIARHDKIHLFDIDFEDMHFKESLFLKNGTTATVVDTEFGKIGIGLCFDVRFPELFRAMTNRGAKLILVPGSFNMRTGPLHWENTLKQRAVDNQIFIAGCSPARDENAIYVSFANSMAVNPLGISLGNCGEEEGCIVEEIDFREVKRARNVLPILKNYKKEEEY